MKVLDQSIYDDWKAKNTDGYGSACFRFAENWANKLEAEIDKQSGKPVPTVIEEFAKKYFHDADDEGITGFMYGMAVSILSHCWIYGKELREWHNLDVQIGNEGERANAEGKVLNPGILNLG